MPRCSMSSSAPLRPSAAKIAAVSVGADGDPPRRFQQHAARPGVHRGHRPLTEDEQIVRRQPKPLLGIEKGHGFRVGRRTGHQIQRNPHAIAPAGGHDLLHVELEERFAGKRSDGEQALGMIEAQTGPLSAGHEEHAELSGPQRFLGPPAGLLRGERVLGGIQTEGRRRHGAGRQFAHVVLAAAGFVQPSNQREVDGLDLPGQRLALAGVEFPPKRQQVFLAVRAEDGLEFGSRSYNPCQLPGRLVRVPRGATANNSTTV